MVSRRSLFHDEAEGEVLEVSLDHRCCWDCTANDHMPDRKMIEIHADTRYTHCSVVRMCTQLGAVAEQAAVDMQAADLRYNSCSATYSGGLLRYLDTRPGRMVDTIRSSMSLEGCHRREDYTVVEADTGPDYKKLFQPAVSDTGADIHQEHNSVFLIYKVMCFDYAL